PDASQLGDRSLLIWPEQDRNHAHHNGNHEDPRDLAARVERTEARFKSLISQIPAVVFYAALGEGENEVFVSPQIEELLGFTAEEWLGDPLLWYRQLHPADHDRLVAAFTRGVQTGEPFRAEVRFFARDGHEVLILGEARLIKDELGRPDFFQGVAFDITATKQAQERVTAIERLRVEELTRINAELTVAKDAAEEAATARQIFLATMTHELRTPLNSVIVLSELLTESPLSSEQAEMVRTMQTSAKFLLKLIADILDFSRLRASSLDLDLQPMDLRAWLTRTIEIAAPAIREKGLAFDVEIDDTTPPVILGDESRLRQILLNLLTNATKFTNEGSIEVYLSALPFDDEWEFICSVDDSGEGVPVDLADALFDEFRQADAGVARRHGGAGLGLAICRQLCSLMGGNIWIEESSLGGARFVFTWRSKALDASALPEAAAPPERVNGVRVPSQLRILVAEDNAVNTFVLRRVLETLGYTAEFVADGFEAVSAVEDADFDVVLMDISMPRMDGLAASRHIRSLGSSVRQPVIVGLTAHAMPGDRNEGIAAGMDDYLTKPIDKAELARALSEAAARGHSA
ncbi:MAG TPA: response regulator, partial [Acidimicrobiales bacterium]|nr:response regulator [Acidimicrobiales bacterium]